MKWDEKQPEYCETTCLNANNCTTWTIVHSCRSMNWFPFHLNHPPPHSQVYITCSVILCEPGTPYSRCAQGCLSDPSRRRRKSLVKETFSHSITQGPFRFIWIQLRKMGNRGDPQRQHQHLGLCQRLLCIHGDVSCSCCLLHKEEKWRRLQSSLKF